MGKIVIGGKLTQITQPQVRTWQETPKEYCEIFKCPEGYLGELVILHTCHTTIGL